MNDLIDFYISQLNEGTQSLFGGISESPWKDSFHESDPEAKEDTNESEQKRLTHQASIRVDKEDDIIELD